MSRELRRELDERDWQLLSETYAYVGGELLEPMNRSKNAYGLDPAFWEGAPYPGDGCARSGLERLCAYARKAQEGPTGGENEPQAVTATSVEYAHLFIGPPRPVASPWESTNAEGSDGRVAYGAATVEMRRLFAERGLVLGGEGNQLEDHMGAELLYLSVLCDEVRAALSDADAARASQAECAAARFIAAHPLEWMDRFRAKVDAECPDGFYSALLEYVHGLLAWQASLAGGEKA